MRSTSTLTDTEIKQQIKKDIAGRLADPERVAQEYGLRDVKRQGRGVMCSCPVHDDSTASLKIDVKEGRLVWKCFGCGASGDIFDLDAAVNGWDVRTQFPQVLESTARRAGVTLPGIPVADDGKPFVDPGVIFKHEDLVWLDNLMLQVAKLDLVKNEPPEAEQLVTEQLELQPAAVKQPEPPAEAEQPAAPPPPARESEYRALWDQSLRLDDPQVSAAVPNHLRGRGFDPAWLVGAVPEQDLARVLPPGAALPSWAACDGVSWELSGHLVLMRAYDALGRLAMLRARAIGPAAKKELVPGGAKIAGTVLVDAAGELVLRVGPQVLGDSLKRSGKMLIVLVAEGVPDFLTLSAWARRWRSTPAAADYLLAVFGVYSGGWTQEVADRLPSGSRVVLRVHSDKGGCGYRDIIADTLARRCTVEVRHPDGIPTARKLPDENDDLKLLGIDGIDPLDGNTPRAAAPRGGWPLTDQGNAERLVYRHGADLRYCTAWSKWIAWDGSRWDTENPLEVERRGVLAARAIREVEAASVKDADFRKTLEGWAMKSENDKLLGATVRRARAIREVEVRPEQLDADPWLLNCPNGVLDLKTAKLRRGARAMLQTKMTSVAYDPAAKCPQWRRFLDQIMDGNQNLVAFLKRAVGYSLTGDTRHHAMFFLHGSAGRNGKGTFLKTLQMLLGNYAKTVGRQILVDRPKDAHPADLASLQGVRFAVVSEADENAHISHDTVKQLVSSDRLPCRGMGKDWSEIEPTHKFWYMVNDVPRFRADDTALLARIKLVPFLVSFLGREDTELQDKLLAELPGILTWAVEGCLECAAQGGLKAPPEVEAHAEKVRAANDDIGRFLGEECNVGPGLRVAKRALYATYKTWCEENGTHPLASKNLGARLEKRGFGEVKSNGIEYRLGLTVRLSNDSTSPASIEDTNAGLDAIATLIQPFN